ARFSLLACWRRWRAASAATSTAALTTGCCTAALARGTSTLTSARGICRLSGRLQKVPTRAVQTHVGCTAQLTHNAAFDVLDPHRNPLRLRRQGIPKLRAGSGIGAGESSIGPSAIRLALPTDDLDWLEERDLVLEMLGRKLPQSRDVAGPQAAAMRRRHDLAVSRVQSDFMHGDRWQIVVELRPVR